MPAGLIAQVMADHERFAGLGLPDDLEGYLLANYGLDMTASYAGSTIRNPWGKASGQLSLNRASDRRGGRRRARFRRPQDRDRPRCRGRAVDVGVGDPRVADDRRADPRAGTRASRAGRVTWKGRGWWQSFDDYLELVRAGCAIGRRRGLLVVPSVKYHLPARADEPWREEEYVETTRSPDRGLSIGGGLGALADREGLLTDARRFGPRRTMRDGAPLAPARPGPDPPVGRRERIGQGRAQALQYPGRRRLPARDARRGSRRGPSGLPGLCQSAVRSRSRVRRPARCGLRRTRPE